MQTPTPPSEPVLSPVDVALWDRWQKTFAMHARTGSFQRAVDGAKRAAERALAKSRSPMLSYSGGKDSTAMTHLVAVEMGARVHVVSEKDDLDYPGEEAYVAELAARWRLDIEIVRPPVSPTAWLLERRGALSAGEDVHSRSAGLSKACFYGVMEAANEKHDLVMMGLRAEESGVRKTLRMARGLNYTLKSGQHRSIPLGDWTGMDVFAYLQLHGIDPLPVYRCIAFLPEHKVKPWLIRKSWWLPGAHAKSGGVAWLRHYYPSLWAKLGTFTNDRRSYA